MTKVTIGGVEYTVAKMKFKQLKLIWPRMRGTFDKLRQARANREAAPGASVDQTFAAVDDAVFVVACAYARTHTFRAVKDADGKDVEKIDMDAAAWEAFFSEELDPQDIPQLTTAIWEMMSETGLVKLGEQPTPEAAALLAELSGTETGTPLSPN